MALPKNSLNNQQLAARMHEHYDGFWRNEYKDMLDILTEVIEDLVLEDKTVRFENFGMFKPKYNKPAKKYNASKREYIVSAGSTGITFKASAALLARINLKAKKQKLIAEQKQDQKETNNA